MPMLCFDEGAMLLLCRSQGQFVESDHSLTTGCTALIVLFVPFDPSSGQQIFMLNELL
jgi:hypothetical protein